MCISSPQLWNVFHCEVILCDVQGGDTLQITLDVFQIDNEHDTQQGMTLMNDVSIYILYYVVYFHFNMSWEQ